VSDKLPAVRPKQLIRVLEKRGWRLDRVRGSHHLMKHPVERLPNRRGTFTKPRPIDVRDTLTPFDCGVEDLNHAE